MTSLLDRAVAYAQVNGKENATAAFNDPAGPFTDGERYVFARDMDGTVLAWLSRPDQIGTNSTGTLDPNGVAHIRRMIELAETGGGRLYYVTGNPANGGREQVKIAEVRPVDGTWFVGTGVYLADLPAVFPASEREELVRRVDSAASYARAQGAHAALRDFNDLNGTFADGSRYIFAYGQNGTTLAMPFQPEAIGTDRTDFADRNGVRVAKWEMDVAKTGGGFVYVDYYNPDTGEPGIKLCYVTPVDETWFVGSGIYARMN
jgi:signal transduction histidine kinase